MSDDKGCAECTDWGNGNCVSGCSRLRCPDCGMKLRTGRHTPTCPRGGWGAVRMTAPDEPPCITDWLCLSGAHLRFGECVEADEPDPFAPGTRVEVHELDGGYLVIPIEETP